MSETLVVTNSCYAALYDEKSPVNVPGFMEREFEGSKRKVLAEGREESMCLFDFNQTLTNLSARGELLAWTLLFDGVFRVTSSIGEPLTAAAPTLDSVALPKTADLYCPTGRLIAGCLGRTGEPQEPLLVVPPGRYRVVFSSADENIDHWFLESVDQYPPGDGPDWSLTIHPIAGSSIPHRTILNQP